MNKNEEKNKQVKDSIITLLNSIADIAKNTDPKTDASKKIVTNFTTSANNLLKELCEKIDTNYDDIFKDFINQTLDKIAKAELAKPRETKKVEKGVFAEDGTTLFEPLTTEKEAWEERQPKKQEDKKNEAKQEEVKSDTTKTNPCNINDKCKDCEFKDVCFIKETITTLPKQKINVVNISTEPTKSNETPENIDEAEDFNNTNTDKSSYIQDLRKEYEKEQKAQKEEEKRKKYEEQQRKEQALMKEVPEIYTKRVFDILSDKRTHAYKFINGDNKANPAVEIKIVDDYNVGSKLSVMTLVCDKIKKEGGFPLVTASKAEAEENTSYITFYLVLY
jgi:hypothetical protein